MTCREFAFFVEPYVDRELDADARAAVAAHAQECETCRQRLKRAGRWRALLRQQPREPLPDDLRRRIVAHLRRTGVTGRLIRWVLTPTVVAVVVVATASQGPRRPLPIVEQVVNAHIVYTRSDSPAEFSATDPGAIEAWFRERLRLRVIVPDYSRAGVRLMGARVGAAGGQVAAYIFYEKGRTPLSVFVVPLAGEAAKGGPSARHTLYRGHAYFAQEHKGYRVVSWIGERSLFALVSTLDYDTLLDCADQLRIEDAQRMAAREVSHVDSAA